MFPVYASLAGRGLQARACGGIHAGKQTDSHKLDSYYCRFNKGLGRKLLTTYRKLWISPRQVIGGLGALRTSSSQVRNLSQH